MNSRTLTKAYSYLRFSRPEQMSGDSFRRQSQLATQYAERHGLVLDEKLTFEDLGVSAFRGRNKDVGGLGDFLDAAEAGLVEKGSYLLVESLDRISRDKVRRALRTLEYICEAGITVVTLIDERVYSLDNLDNDPIALITSVLTFMRANEESATKARRLKSAWENKRGNAREKPLTSRAPAWLRLDKDVGKFEVNGERAGVVRRVYQMALDGIGQNLIAETFNREQVPVFGRGKHWHRSYIAKLLQNPAVIGTMTPHRVDYIDGKRHRVALEPIEDYFPSIVDQSTYDRYQAMRLDSPNPQRGRHSSKEVQNLFGGLARCPQCGSTMTRVSKGNRKKAGQPKLVCTKAKTGAGCQYHSVPYDDVETAFLDNASYLLGTIPAGKDDPEVDDAIDKIEVNIGGAEDSIERLLDALQAGKSTVTMDRIRLLEGELEAMRNEHDDLLQLKALTTSPLVYHKAEDLAAILETGEMDRGLVNALLRQMLTGITVDYTAGTLVFHWLQGGASRVAYGWPK